MMKRSRLALITAAPLLLLAACSEAPKVDNRAGEAKRLQAGEFEVTAKVASLVSTDKSTPSTKLRVGATATAKGCVGADGIPEPALFTEPGDQCKIDNSYVSGAILNLAIKCTRALPPGYVTSAVDGSFTADSFTATVTTDTSFYGNGDYKLVRNVTARRVGVCPPAPTVKKG